MRWALAVCASPPVYHSTVGGCNLGFVLDANDCAKRPGVPSPRQQCVCPPIDRRARGWSDLAHRDHAERCRLRPTRLIRRWTVTQSRAATLAAKPAGSARFDGLPRSARRASASVRESSFKTRVGASTSSTRLRSENPATAPSLLRLVTRRILGIPGRRSRKSRVANRLRAAFHHVVEISSCSASRCSRRSSSATLTRDSNPRARCDTTRSTWRPPPASSPRSGVSTQKSAPAATACLPPDWANRARQARPRKSDLAPPRSRPCSRGHVASRRRRKPASRPTSTGQPAPRQWRSRQPRHVADLASTTRAQADVRSA